MIALSFSQMRNIFLAKKNIAVVSNTSEPEKHSIDVYECVIRFHRGVLHLIPELWSKVDILVLNGWYADEMFLYYDFLKHYPDVMIFFSRPKSSSLKNRFSALLNAITQRKYFIPFRSIMWFWQRIFGVIPINQVHPIYLKDPFSSLQNKCFFVEQDLFYEIYQKTWIRNPTSWFVILYFLFTISHPSITPFNFKLDIQKNMYYWDNPTLHSPINHQTKDEFFALKKLWFF